MKSVVECRHRLAKQWHQAKWRVARLLQAQWPVEINVGRPSPQQVAKEALAVRQHIKDWRRVSVGKVEFEEIIYRATGQALKVPTKWILYSAEEWVSATEDKAIAEEYSYYRELEAEAPPEFRECILRRWSNWLGLRLEDAICLVRVGLELRPGQAEGLPLRAMAVDGVNLDTKFVERHRGLLVGLLDVRFGRVVSALGLESFLGAERVGVQWLLVIDLDGRLMPVRQMRVRSVDFVEKFCDCDRVLVVENERCVHFLPRLEGTLAVLGAGLNLEWLSAEWLGGVRLGYWGDIDSWGLLMLSQARRQQPALRAVLMSGAVLDGHLQYVVSERRTAGAEVPPDLLTCEADLYRRIEPKAVRLEQEYIKREWIESALMEWLSDD